MDRRDQDGALVGIGRTWEKSYGYMGGGHVLLVAGRWPDSDSSKDLSRGVSNRIAIHQTLHSNALMCHDSCFSRFIHSRML